MDKELIVLQKEIIKRLIDYEDQLQSLGDSNQLKKVRRVSSSVAMNIAAFPDLVQNLLDSGVSTDKIARKLRNVQEAILNENVRIKGTLTAHHRLMLRTGGSFYRADYEKWGPAVRQLADFFETQFGDVSENLQDFLNFVHKSDTNTKGLELDTIGKKANPNPLLTAHPWGTTARWITENLSRAQLEDPVELFNALAGRIDAQFAAADVATELSAPLNRALNTINPAGDIETTQKLVKLPENQAILKDAVIEVVKGVARFNRDLFKPGMSTPDEVLRAMRGNAKGLALSGVAAPAAFGVAASTAEVAQRTAIANKTDNWLDKAQLGLAGVSLAGDFAGPWGEVVSTPADLVNTGIDEVRSFIDDPVGHVTERSKTLARGALNPAGPAAALTGAEPIIDPLNPIGSVKRFIPGTKEQQQHHEETIEKAQQVIGVVNGSIRWLGDQWNQNWANHPLNPDREKEDKLSVGFAEGGF